MAKTPAKHRQPWTAGEVKELKTLAKGNTPTRVIALKLMRTPAAVQAKAGEEEISLKPANQKPYGTAKKKP